MTTTVCNTETLHIIICISGVIEIQVSMFFKKLFFFTTEKMKSFSLVDTIL